LCTQALPGCSIAEAPQGGDDEEEEEEQQQEQSLAKGLGAVFGRTQAVKAQPQQPQVMRLCTLVYYEALWPIVVAGSCH